MSVHRLGEYGGLSNAVDAVFGPDGNLYVGSRNNNSILRFDGATGALIDTFVSGGSGGLAPLLSMVFGPDDNLYVASSDNNGVLRYDGQTGAFIDEFAVGGGLFAPSYLTFIPEPATLALLAMGWPMLFRRRR